MMKLSCKDLGDSTCAFTAFGDSTAEVEGRMLHHAMVHHADKLQDMGEMDTVGMMDAMHSKLDME